MENAHTFNCFDASSFVPRREGARLPDAMIKMAIMDTPDEVKGVIEKACFGNADLMSLPEHKQMDALVLNAIIWTLEKMGEDTGHSDFQGVLDAYKMPKEYRNLFHGLLRVDAMLSPQDSGEGVWDDDGWRVN